MRTTKFLAACLLTLSVFSCKQPDYNNKDAEIEKKVEALLSKMTLEEKIGQMNQISSSGNIEEMSELIKKGEIGSILNEVDPVRVNQLQRAAVEGSRLGIPVLIARDVIHGFKTIFPIPLGQAASFDPEIAREGARVAAVEASSVGVRWTFAPMIDISRDPRWGRIAESCGEDPYLTAVMGAAMVKGFQGDSLNDPTAIAACAKHFVGYGAAEGGRDYNSTFISERNLRNIYLPSFEAAEAAGAATFMTSFNDNDGVPSTGNKFILRDVLRGEWGFDGIVVTDWNSAREMINHGFAADDKDVAEKSVNAGVDMEMVSYTFVKQLPELVKEGKVKESVIDEAVRNILRVKFRLGLFDNPYVDENKPSVFYNKEHLAAAKRAVEESTILLKNENAVLPLGSNVRTIAVVGPMADAPHDQMGTWVFDGDKTHTQTPLAALKAMYGDKVNIIYEPGLTFSRDTNAEGIRKAAAAAARADVILAFLGEEAILSGEAHSLADISLKGAQTQLLEALENTGKPVVSIIMAGRPLTIAHEVELSDAVLYSFHPGTMGGPALADLIFGKAVPSGKTPVTFVQHVGQVPLYYAHHNTGRPARKGVKPLAELPLEAGQTSEGSNSSYMDYSVEPLFPFGYGLSYTTFSYGTPKLSATELAKNDVLKVSFELANTGKYEATEIVQLYVQDKVASVTRPVKELKRFTRVTLKPGEKRMVEFELPIADLAFWNIDMKKVVEPGEFALWVAADSESGEPLTFTVK